LRGARVKRIFAALASPWGIAVLAAVAVGSLFGIALGAGSVAFFVGCATGASLAAFASARLRSGRAKAHQPPETRDAPRAQAPYDLETDRSTDNQRWPM
jgi:hypothetical protein